MWVDSHCHLTAEVFDEDRNLVLERARYADVELMIAIGSGYGVLHNEHAPALAGDEADVFATVGVHPHEAQELDEDGRARLHLWLREPRVVAVGECGLDYWYEYSPRAVQRAVFAEQVALARELGLPVSIHVRDRGSDAYEELLDLWRSEGRGDVRGVLHCFTGSLDFARRALDENLWISFSGILTFKRDHGLRDTARALPLDRLLVETDAPLLAPEGLRGRRNEPANVARVGEVLAELHGIPLADLAARTTANARGLFGLQEPE